METQKPYLKYKKQLKKIGIFSAIISAITIVSIVAWIFLPIFAADEEKFSMFNEFMIFVEAIRLLNSGGTEIYFTLLCGLFPLFVIIMGIITVAMQIKKLLTDLTNLNDKGLAIRYAQIKKTGEEKDKKNFFKQNTIFSFIIYFLFAIIYGKLLGAYVGGHSYFYYLTGVSLLVVIPALLFIAYCTLAALKSKENKSLIYSIVSEDENDKSDTETEEKPEKNE